MPYSAILSKRCCSGILSFLFVCIPVDRWANSTQHQGGLQTRCQKPKNQNILYYYVEPMIKVALQRVCEATFFGL